jgi:hypothetical protein
MDAVISFAVARLGLCILVLAVAFSILYKPRGRRWFVYTPHSSRLDIASILGR